MRITSILSKSFLCDQILKRTSYLYKTEYIILYNLYTIIFIFNRVFRKNASAESQPTAPESDARDDDFQFSVAEGVSTAQNAFPDTHIGGNESGQKANGFTVEELTLLKTVDTTDSEMMEIYSENRENNKILDEIEQYVIRKLLLPSAYFDYTFQIWNAI